MNTFKRRGPGLRLRRHAIIFFSGMLFHAVIVVLWSTGAHEDQLAEFRCWPHLPQHLSAARSSPMNLVKGVETWEQEPETVKHRFNACVAEVEDRDRKYTAYSAKAEVLHAVHGALNIAAFSRLWPPPLHNTGGMQYHALHLYSQLAARGHHVVVFVTGPPTKTKCRRLLYTVDKSTHDVRVVVSEAHASLIVQQVPSRHNGEYSVEWVENCLEYFQLEHSKRAFHVVHSESWAAVPNIFQLGLPFAVTWHGSMLDWLRNEINLIVHNYRIYGTQNRTRSGTAVAEEKKKIPPAEAVERMKALGGAVAMEAYMYLSIPQHIAISEVVQEGLQNLNLIDPQKVKLIYNGVNEKNFHPLPTTHSGGFWQGHSNGDVRGQFLLALGVPATDFVVGCGGRLEGIKGHHQLSRAMELVLRADPHVTLLVAGSGSEASRYLHLQQLLNREELAAHGGAGEGAAAAPNGPVVRRHRGRVIMLGMLPQQRLAQFYQSIDVFVDPFYQQHGLNTVMLEAALSAVPLVVSRLGSAFTTVPCEAYGRTFLLGDIKDMARAILYYKVHPLEREEVSRRVRERAARLFSSRLMADMYETLFYEMFANPPVLENISGKVVCQTVYPAMCYRRPI